MRLFFGTPTTLVALLLIAGWMMFNIAGSPYASAEERKPLMNLDKGAMEFFPEIVPSIIQIYNGGIMAGRMGGAGSGYIIDREGHFITNKHVADEAPAMEVAFYGDHKFSRAYNEGRHKATLIAEDAALDLAVGKVEAPAEKFHPVRLGDSHILKPGDTVATFGSPGGDPGWVDYSTVAFEDSWLEYYNLNLGVISEVLNFEEAFWTYFPYFNQNPEDQVKRSGVRDYGTAVQYLFHVDAAINRGNSGGPCLNVYGEAIGTNTWGFGAENIGFSVPVNLLKRSVADIIKYGRVKRPWLGIALHPPRTAWKKYIEELRTATTPYPYGVWFDTTPEKMKIYTVNPYSPAYSAGLRVDDVIRRIDNQSFRNIFDLYAYILNSDVGQEIIIDYERKGHGMQPIKVNLAEKITRYTGTIIEAYAAGPYSTDVTRYSSDLTY